MNLKRFKKLINYPLNEEMEMSSDFNDINKIESNSLNNAVILSVGIDKENDNEHELKLILLYQKHGFTELSFYFSIYDIDGKIVSINNKKAIYDRTIVKKYLPKELIGKNIFINKIVEMFKKLDVMEKQKRFFLVSYEDYIDDRQMAYYQPLIREIQNIGYYLNSQGKFEDKKYYWEFLEKGSNITEALDMSKFATRDEIQKGADEIAESFSKNK